MSITYTGGSMQTTPQHPAAVRRITAYMVGSHCTYSLRLCALMHAQWLFGGKRPLTEGKVRHLRRLKGKGLVGRCPKDFNHVAFCRALALAAATQVDPDRLHDFGTLEISECQDFIYDPGSRISNSMRNVGQLHSASPFKFSA